MGIKLYYFDGRGLAEPIRWILYYGGIPFEDVRAPVDEFPPVLPAEIKAKSRWGQVPFLELDCGRTISQSAAICRYLAKQAKLIPGDSYDAALADEYADSIRDFMRGFSDVMHEEDKKKKQELLEKCCQTVKSKYLDKFESLIKENGGKCLIGSSLSWADLLLAYSLHQTNLLLGVDLAKEYSKISDLCAAVESSPGIKEWLAKRPNTIF